MTPKNAKIEPEKYFWMIESHALLIIKSYKYSPLSSAAGRATCSRTREGGGLSATNVNSR